MTDSKLGPGDTLKAPAGRGAGGGRHGGAGGGGRMGRGGGGRGSGLGSGGACLCPRCGYRAPHQPASPCIHGRCPDCGSALVREGSPAHRAIEDPAPARR